MQPKGLSGVFSNTTVQKHQLFGAQFSLKWFSFLGMLLTGGYQANHNIQGHGCYADLSPCLPHLEIWSYSSFWYSQENTNGNFPHYYYYLLEEGNFCYTFIASPISAVLKILRQK